ncbi:MAG: Slp family lipoprotein [Rhodanobacter sp.]
MSIFRLSCLVAALVLFVGCATVPEPLQGTYAGGSSASVQGVASHKDAVRWGGTIINAVSDSKRTCFYLLARPLDHQARPRAGSANSEDQDRFVTCHQGRYDPQVFAQGRDLTIVGTVHGTVMQQTGGREQAYPLVNADVVYLWPKRENAGFPSDSSSLMGNPQYPPEIDRQPTGALPPTVK